MVRLKTKMVTSNPTIETSLITLQASLLTFLIPPNTTIYLLGWLFFVVHWLNQVLKKKSCCGVVVIMLVLHIKALQFDPGQQQFFDFNQKKHRHNI